MSRNILCLLFLCFFTFGCEKDDICNEGTRIFGSDSVTIPMDLSKNFTRYAFILPSSTASLTIADTLQFNHSNRRDQYSRRACGFSAAYELDNPAITTIGSITWYAYSVTQLDTIRNEEQAHLFIYH